MLQPKEGLRIHPYSFCGLSYREVICFAVVLHNPAEIHEESVSLVIRLDKRNLL